MKRSLMFLAAMYATLTLRAATNLAPESVAMLPSMVPQIRLPQDAPKGVVKQLSFSASRIFPGTVHDISVFIPAQYDGSKPACVYLKMDGYNPKGQRLLEGLIAGGFMPVTIGVFVKPGALSAPDGANTLSRPNRIFEYDTLGDGNVRFFIEELLPFVAKEMNLQLDPALAIRIDSAGWSMKTGQHPMAPEIGYKPMQGLLERTHEFTAVFCFNDISAIGAIRALKDAGLSVPGDVSVVGFDDILSASYFTPSLTTVRQPLSEMGRRGAQILLERIGDRKKAFPSDIVVEPELVIRESTGPAKNGC